MFPETRVTGLHLRRW